MVFSAPSGCYYGLLNVLDPSIAYDSNGKIISVLRLPEAEESDETQRDPYDDLHDEADDIRAEEEPLVEEPAAEPFPEQEDPPTELVNEQDTKPAEDDAVVSESNPASPKEGFFTVPSVGLASVEVTPQEAKPVRSESPPKVETVYSEYTAEPEPQYRDVPVSPVASFRGIPGATSMGAVSLSASVARSTVSAPAMVQTVRSARRKDPEADVLPPVQELPIPMFVNEAKDKLEPESEEQQVESTVEPETEAETQAVPQSIVLVADYMEATPLFKTILRKNWKAVLYFLRTGSFSFSPLLGAVDMAGVELQVQTWVSKKDTYGTEMWRQLPLHAAICYGAPANVIEKLVEAYPGALESPDSHGNLPLHLAFIFDSDDSVAASLMKAFPASLHIINAEGLQPIQCSNEICSETFQSKAELFGALSDYTRAVAEKDPARLEEQLQDVHRQLKAVNDTLFATAPPRKPEAIKEYLAESNTSLENSTAMVSYGPSAFLAEIATGICPLSSGYDTQEDSIPRGTATPMDAEPKETEAPLQERLPVEQSEPTPPVVPVDSAIAVIAGGSALVVPVVSEKLPAPDPPQHKACRVMEFDPKSRTWRDI